MAVRTATATTLDSAITSLFTALDAYLALRGQTGEPKNAAEKYFWSVMQHKFRERATTEALLVARYNPRPIPKTTAKTVVALDPLA